MRYNSGMAKSIPDKAEIHATSIRLSQDAQTLRSKLAKKMGINQTAVIETAIRLLAEQKGVTVEGR